MLLDVTKPASPFYDTLKHHDSIRLFHLLPSSKPTDKIVGYLVTARRASQPSYQALSYMWGPKDSESEQETEVNGHGLLIRANLFSALKAIREHKRQSRIEENSPLWIDLICIQQDCVAEKNHQVQQMGAIYTEANGVLIWLGTQTRLELPPHEIRPARRDRQVTKSSEYQDNSVDTDSTLATANHRALLWALLNQHWTRTWILQEICLAKTVSIITGSHIFHDAQIEEFPTAKTDVEENTRQSWINLDPDKGHPHTIMVAAIERFEKIWRVRQSRKDNRWRPLSLCSVVHQLALQSECHEHRDKVYAVLGLASQGTTIKVDYSIDEVVLFWDTIKITSMRNIDEHETEALREVLQLDWIRILRYTRKVIATDRLLQSLMLPCHLDCEFISEKRARRQPPRQAHKLHRFGLDCRYEKDSGAMKPFLLRLQLRQDTSDQYLIENAVYCPDIELADVKSGTTYNLPSLVGCQIQSLDTSWNTRRESVAVDPLLYVTLQLLAKMGEEQTETELQSILNDVI